MWDNEEGWIAPVQSGECLVEVGGVGDVLRDVDIRRQGRHRGDACVEGDAHVVDQERVHHVDWWQPHRQVSLQQSVDLNSTKNSET